MNTKVNKSLKQDIISKVISILRKDVKGETEIDSLLKDAIKIMMSKDSDTNKIAFPSVPEENQNLLIIKLIELIYLVFQVPKDKRNNLWKIDIENIKDKNISGLIFECEVLQNSIEVLFPTEKMAELSDIIFDSNIKKKYTLIDYINSIIANISFIPQMNMLLKYKIYLLLIDKYICFLGDKIDFREVEINLEDEISIDIILDLLKNKKQDDIIFIQLLVILKYESLRNTIIKYNIAQILQAFANTNFRIKNELDISPIIYHEKIIMIFNEEIENINDKKMKKKRNIKTKKITGEHIETNNEKINEEEPKYINEEKKRQQIISFICDDNNNNQNSYEQLQIIENKGKKFDNNANNPTNKNIPINIKSELKELSEEIKPKKESYNSKTTEEKNINLNNNINIGDINKNDINALLDKILNMEKNSKEPFVNELKNILYKIIDDNKEMKKNIENIKKELDSKNNDLNSIKKELDSKTKDWACLKKAMDKDKKILNEKIDDLYSKNDEMKQILGNIQTRDFAKNFLRCFKRYLTDEDKKEIEDNLFSKGKIISKRIQEKFSAYKENREMDVLLNLINFSFDSLNTGNTMAHSILIENYKEEIGEYKKIKKLRTLNSPYIFCFLIGLGIPEEYFDESFAFLKRYFYSSLTLKKRDKGFLEDYFN